MTKRDEPAQRQHEVQAGREQADDDDIDHQDQTELAGHQREQRQRRQQCGGKPPSTAFKQSDRLLGVADLAVFTGRLFTAKQAVGPDHQDNGHHDEHQHQSTLRQKTYTQHVEHGNENRGNECAWYRAHAANHNHDKDGRENVEVHEKIGTTLGQLKRAAEAGQHRAKKEHTGEQPGLIDAESADHFPILGCGAHEDANSRARYQVPQSYQNNRCRRDQRQVVHRDRLIQYMHDTRQSRSARSKKILGPPNYESQILNDEDDPEGRDELEQLRRPVHTAQNHELHEHADNADRDASQQRRQPESDWPGQPLQERVADVGPQHVERAVGEIDDPGDPEDQRQPGCNEKKCGGVCEAGEQLCNK